MKTGLSLYKASRNVDHLFSISENNCIIHWIEIYPVDSDIHLFRTTVPRQSDQQSNIPQDLRGHFKREFELPVT